MCVYIYIYIYTYLLQTLFLAAEGHPVPAHNLLRARDTNDNDNNDNADNNVLNNDTSTSLSLYIHLSLSIYIYTHTNTLARTEGHLVPAHHRLHALRHRRPLGLYTANIPTNIVAFWGFDSSIILI